MAEFKAGMTVHLKSGGPVMTVRGPAGMEVSCEWFDGTNQLQAGQFPPDMLEEARGDETGDSGFDTRGLKSANPA
jgi:uncharacterized protein YodC (DUF2158 family)